MGQTLSEPITTKEITVCQSSEYGVASASMQGWRIGMEDAHTHILGSPDDENAAFFGIYDGHGGARVAQVASMKLHKKIIGNEHYVNNDFHTAIKTGFLNLDEELKQDEETKEQMSGTTAVTVLIKDRKIYCGNAGDSRAVLCQRGKARKCVGSWQQGGWVDACRVNGNLALSRALGDFIFKNNDSLRAEEQIVTALPDIIEVEITDEHEFIILACDGIWDVLSNEQAVAYCRKRLGEGSTPEKICEELVDRCLAPDCELSGVGCDNMSVILVCLLQGESKEAYTERVKRESLVADDQFVQDMLQGLKFDQNFANNASPFVLQNARDNIFGDDVIESMLTDAMLSRANERNTMHVDDPKPSEQAFITPPNEVLHQDESDDPPPAVFEVIPHGTPEK
ncbi:hypothetical protein M3Y97_00833900 [Aphelenchoides bicaudatus]|nr:hypothetical protein M3Y97_00833900 [Aphelenchoides bicaudatus]